MNWLRVFRSAEASRLSHDVSQQLHTRMVRSEKCVARRDGCGTEMGVIAVCFARGLHVCIGCAYTGLLLILQEVRRVCKTRNQFSGYLEFYANRARPQYQVAYELYDRLL